MSPISELPTFLAMKTSEGQNLLVLTITHEVLEGTSPQARLP